MDFKKRKASPTPFPRATRRPTAMVKSVNPTRLQEAILGTFSRFGVNSMDMEALIYFSLQVIPDLVDPITFESVHRFTRQHILKNFAIHQSGPIRLAEVSMYRLVVCYTDDTDV